MAVYFRNTATGELWVGPEGTLYEAELRKLRTTANEHGQTFPLWEQTSKADIDPLHWAAASEYAEREKHAVRLSTEGGRDVHPYEVSSDGTIKAGSDGITLPAVPDNVGDGVSLPIQAPDYDH